MNLSKQIRKSAREAAGPATDFEDTHGLWVLALTDVTHVGEDVISYVLLAGRKKILIGPIGFAVLDVVAGIFARAGVPIAPHLCQLFLAGDFLASRPFDHHQIRLHDKRRERSEERRV